jgi:hypothetical protein
MTYREVWPGVAALVMLGLIMFVPVAMVMGDDTKSLNVLVPLKLGFQEFVAWRHSATNATTTTTTTSISFSGFSIEVFERCVEVVKLNHTLDYTFVGYGDGLTDPLYDGLLQTLADSEANLPSTYLSIIITFLTLIRRNRITD